MRNIRSREMDRPALWVTFSIAVTSSGLVRSSGSYWKNSGSINHGLMKKTKKKIGKAQIQKCSHHRRGFRLIRYRRIEPKIRAAPTTSASSLAQSYIHDPQPCTDCWYSSEIGRAHV